NNSNLPWNWFGISVNPNITIDFIKENLDKEWWWFDLSRHHNITLDMNVNNPDLPWDLDGISYNPNLTWRIIYDNQDKPWGWYYISINEFNKNKYVRERLISKKYFHIWQQKYIKIKKERN